MSATKRLLATGSVAPLLVPLTIYLAWGCSFLTSKDPYRTGWRNEFPPRGTLGSSLEKTFSTMLAACNARPVAKGKSSVPLLLQQAMNDNIERSVITVDGESSWNLFRYIFPTESLSTFLSSNLADYLDESLIPQALLPTPDPGSRNVVHRQSCSSVVTAALNAGLKVPQGSIEGALRDDYQDHMELALVEGRFFSPLSQYLRPTASSETKYRTLIGIWEWYHGRGQYDTTKTWRYLAGFTGLGLFTLRTTGKQLTRNLTGQLAINALFGSLKGNSAASLTDSASSSVRDFSTLVYTGAPPSLNDELTRLLTTFGAKPARRRTTPDSKGSARSQSYIQLSPLPSPRSIVDAFAELQPIQQPNSKTTVDPDERNAVLVGYRLPEIPNYLCDERKWAASDDTERVVVEFSFTYDSLCNLTAHFRPSMDKGLETVGASKQFFWLFTKDGILVGDSTLQIGIPFPVRLNVNLSPKIGPTTVGSPGYDEKQHQYYWRVTVELQGTEEVDWRYRPGIDPSMYCGSVRANGYADSVVTDSGKSSITFSLHMAALASDTAGAPSVCNAYFNFTILRKNGKLPARRFTQAMDVLALRPTSQD